MVMMRMGEKKKIRNLDNFHKDLSNYCRSSQSLKCEYNNLQEKEQKQSDGSTTSSLKKMQRHCTLKLDGFKQLNLILCRK